MPTSELIIFDCDGVLIDSEVVGCAVDAEALTEAGIPIALEDILQRFTGTTSREMYETLVAEHGRPLPDDFAERVRRRTDEVFERDLRAIEGIHEVLDQIDLRACVASSSTYRRLQKTLGMTKLYDCFFPHIFSAESVARGKPAPDLFLHVAEQMRTAPERCLVIEDSVRGVQAGIAAGMRVLGFVGGSHCGPDSEAQLLAAGAELVFARMAELPALLRKVA